MSAYNMKCLGLHVRIPTDWFLLQQDEVLDCAWSAIRSAMVSSIRDVPNCPTKLSEEAWNSILREADDACAFCKECLPHIEPVILPDPDALLFSLRTTDATTGAAAFRVMHCLLYEMHKALRTPEIDPYNSLRGASLEVAYYDEKTCHCEHTRLEEVHACDESPYYWE